jgi:hypothetical protein
MARPLPIVLIALGVGLIVWLLVRDDTTPSPTLADVEGRASGESVIGEELDEPTPMPTVPFSPRDPDPDPDTDPDAGVGTVTIVTVNENAEPVPDVTLHLVDQTRSVVAGRTDAHGTLTLPEESLAVGVELVAKPPVDGSLRVTVHKIETPPESTLTIVLKPGARIRGYVLGASRAGMRVIASRMELGMIERDAVHRIGLHPQHLESIVDEAGRFTIANTEADALYQVQAVSRGEYGGAGRVHGDADNVAIRLRQLYGLHIRLTTADGDPGIVASGVGTTMSPQSVGLQIYPSRDGVLLLSGSLTTERHLETANDPRERVSWLVSPEPRDEEDIDLSIGIKVPSYEQLSARVTVRRADLPPLINELVLKAASDGFGTLRLLFDGDVGFLDPWAGRTIGTLHLIPVPITQTYHEYPVRYDRTSSITIPHVPAGEHLWTFAGQGGLVHLDSQVIQPPHVMIINDTTTDLRLPLPARGAVLFPLDGALASRIVPMTLLVDARIQRPDGSVRSVRSTVDPRIHGIPFVPAGRVDLTLLALLKGASAWEGIGTASGWCVAGTVTRLDVLK